VNIIYRFGSYLRRNTFSVCKGQLANTVYGTKIWKRVAKKKIWSWVLTGPETKFAVLVRLAANLLDRLENLKTYISTLNGTYNRHIDEKG
jgi:hypothetical protein